MKQYHSLLTDILVFGDKKSPARENMPGTTSIFGYQCVYNLEEGFPMVTTKKLSFSNIVHELLWFLRGDTNIKYLVDRNDNIWNEDAYNYYQKVINRAKLLMRSNYKNLLNKNGTDLLTFEEFVETIKNKNFEELPRISWYVLGDCGMQYGKLWRRWNPEGEAVIDQLYMLIQGIRFLPESRRHILTSWNPETLDFMALNACHAIVQFNCVPLSGGEHPYRLDCQMYQRSADVFLGVPFNIASYALFTHLIAKICNYKVGKFIHTFGDVHLYDNHKKQALVQLEREPYPLPQLQIDLPDTEFINSYDDFNTFINSLTIDNFKLLGYKSHPAIKAPLSTGLKKP